MNLRRNFHSSPEASRLLRSQCHSHGTHVPQIISDLEQPFHMVLLHFVGIRTHQTTLSHKGFVWRRRRPPAVRVPPTVSVPPCCPPHVWLPGHTVPRYLSAAKANDSHWNLADGKRTLVGLYAPGAFSGFYDVSGTRTLAGRTCTVILVSPAVLIQSVSQDWRHS